MPHHASAAAPGLPAAALHEIHDCLVLALNATERGRGCTRSEREARSYMRSALRQTMALMEVQG